MTVITVPPWGESQWCFSLIIWCVYVCVRGREITVIIPTPFLIHTKFALCYVAVKAHLAVSFLQDPPLPPPKCRPQFCVNQGVLHLCMWHPGSLAHFLEVLIINFP